MALSGCYALMKYILILFNLIFWVSGLTILVLSIWMMTDDTFVLNFAHKDTPYYTGLYLLLAVGAIMFIVGLIGCLGAFRESTFMLLSFFCVLLIVLVAEIAAGTWAYKNFYKLEEELQKNVKFSVQNEYGEVKSFTEAFDTIQKGLDCCGAEGPMDWMNSKYNNPNDDPEKSIVDLITSAIPRTFRIPESCCKDSASEKSCKLGQMVGVAAAINPYMNSDGCVEKLINVTKQNMMIGVGIAIAIGVIEILGLIFSLVLRCAIRSTDRYKA